MDDMLLPPTTGSLTDSSRTAAPGLGVVDLYPRELDILRLVVNGLTNAEISNQLTLSRNTTKTYIRRIYRKIDAASRAQAVAWGAQRGLLDPNY